MVNINPVSVNLVWKRYKNTVPLQTGYGYRAYYDKYEILVVGELIGKYRYWRFEVREKKYGSHVIMRTSGDVFDYQIAQLKGLLYASTSELDHQIAQLKAKQWLEQHIRDLAEAESTDDIWSSEQCHELK